MPFFFWYGEFEFSRVIVVRFIGSERKKKKRKQNPSLKKQTNKQFGRTESTSFFVCREKEEFHDDDDDDDEREKERERERERKLEAASDVAIKKKEDATQT